MTWQIPTDDQPKMLKAVRSFFMSNGWTVKDAPRDARIDLVATDRELTYFLTVVDEAQKRFFRLERMVEGMAHDTYEIKGLKHQTLIYILNFRFPSLSFEALVERGVSAFALDEMDLLRDLTAYQDELPPPLGVREIAVLEGNAKVCLGISNRFHKSGDRASAIKWGEYAIKRKSGVWVAYMRLFRLYLEEDDLDNADRIGKEVFSFQPENIEFLKLMEKLAIQRGDPATAETYRARRENADTTAPPKNFADLIKKQTAQRALSNPSLAASSAVEAQPRKTGIAKMLDRLRRSSS
jgi:tetratricopeptide (TPR) repeat protein